MTAKGGANPDAAQLKKLFQGFSSQAAKLDTLCTQMETAANWMLEPNAAKSPNQPGKALQNLLNAPKIKAFNDAGKLRLEFYDKIEAYTLGGFASMKKGRFDANGCIF